MSDELRRWIYKRYGKTQGTYLDEETGLYVIKKEDNRCVKYFCGNGTNKKNWKRITLRR